MNVVGQAVTWLNDPLNWTNPDGILVRLGEHLRLCSLALLLALCVGWPLGFWLGHRGASSGVVVLLSNVTQAVPVIVLLTVLPLMLGFGSTAVIVALAVFSVPPLVATAYTGLRQVDPEVRDASRGMGFSGWQTLWRVEVPLAIGYLAAGLRTSAVQVVATAALASAVNGGGLGQIISAGFGLGIAAGGGQILAGGLLIVVLALAVEAIGSLLQRLVTPRSLRDSGRRGVANM